MWKSIKEALNTLRRTTEKPVDSPVCTLSEHRTCLFCRGDVEHPALIDQFLSAAPHWDILCDGCMETAFLNGIPECPWLDDVKLSAVRMSLIEARIIISNSGVGSMLA